MTGAKRRSGLRIMAGLIGLVKPLMHIMAGAVVLGTLGYLCAIFLTILAAEAVLGVLKVGASEPLLASMTAGANLPWEGLFSRLGISGLFVVMTAAAVLRGVLHYAEQYCNHFIAFKLLAIIRHKVFAALRRLCPAKLEGKDRGNLISIITTDIELLEVFYAHTISPIAIAFLTSLVMAVFIGLHSLAAAGLALFAYMAVGIAIPLWMGRKGSAKGMEMRTGFGELNSFVLDSLRGLDETIQYGQGEKQKEKLKERAENLAGLNEKLSRLEGQQRAVTNLVILLASFGMLFLTLFLYVSGRIGFESSLICTVAMMGSFGPVVALSSLSNNLNQTLACGERVLSILEETPEVEEIPEASGTSNREQTKVAEKVLGAGETRGKAQRAFEGAKAREVDFSYGGEEILKGYCLSVKPGEIVGIHGPSGSGKSTVLKLFMRFWDVKNGQMCVSKQDVREIPTRQLRDMQGYVTQETHLFHDSIAKNIEIGRPGASREDIIEAAKKASIYKFIETLPKGYDTEVGELGETLSGGERQRIGVARAFLHDAPFLMLDEPTSNLDSLNEGIILKSLREAGREKTVLLVSHRKSTMNVADRIFEMDKKRVS